MNGRLVSTGRITPARREEMLRLLERSFAGTTRRGFLRDLEDKNWAILLEDDAGSLAGFSTLRFDHATHAGRPFSFVCSGDTVVDPDHCGTSVLSRTWIDSVWRLHRQYGRGRLFWLLITSGFRTYRFLPVFWQDFFPRHDRNAPAPVRRLRDRLALARFGSKYDPSTGIVRFDEPQRLREPLCAIPQSRLRDAHVAFFARANPGYTNGDELACLTELCESNLTAAGRRMVEAGTSRHRMVAAR